MIKNIRGIHDKTHNKYWFSAADIIALIFGCHNIKARNYWKWFKNKEKISTVQIKIPCGDGKLRYCDMVDIDQILEMIMKLPSPKAIPWRVKFLHIKKEGILKELVEMAALCLKMFKDTYKKWTMKVTKVKYILFFTTGWSFAWRRTARPCNQGRNTHDKNPQHQHVRFAFG